MKLFIDGDDDDDDNERFHTIYVPLAELYFQFKNNFFWLYSYLYL